MIAIKAENISKKYLIKHEVNAKSDSLKDIFSSFWQSKSKSKAEEFWALKNINFEINHGDRVGIIGSNGAGKSTLLKVLSRITQPTTGQIKIRGKVASLLEVGTGFNPELSGRENIFLNGAILGMRKAEIISKFDEIVDFSGVEKFLDTPVKRYSSGMYVRLGFSIAAHLQPDILIVDEVLAVGDTEFQKKCMGKMKDVSGEGRTILFVSHNLTAVEGLCNRAIYLQKGTVVTQGDTKSVVSTYLKNYSKNNFEQTWPSVNQAPGNDQIKFKRVQLFPQYLPSQETIDVRNELKFEIEIENFEENSQLNFSIFLNTLAGECVFNVTSIPRQYLKGTVNAKFTVPSHLLNDGSYSLSVMVVKDTTTVLHFLEECINFEINDWRPIPGNCYGKWPGIIRPTITVDTF